MATPPNGGYNPTPGIGAGSPNPMGGAPAPAPKPPEPTPNTPAQSWWLKGQSAPGVPTQASTNVNPTANAPNPLSTWQYNPGGNGRSASVASLQQTDQAAIAKLKAQGFVPGTAQWDQAWQGQAQYDTKQMIGQGESSYLDASGSPTTQRTDAYGKQLAQQAGPGAHNFLSNIGGITSYTDPTKAALFGDPNAAFNANQALQQQGANAEGRAAPGIQTGAVNMINSAAGGDLNQANNTGFASYGNALNLAGTATGAGYQGQLGSANALMGMSHMPTGPSVAEQQLKQGADASMQQQMALASQARGGNAAAALGNAGAQQGAVMGQLNSQLGVQRAQEDMANRQYMANTAQAAGGMYGQAAGTQQGAFAGAGQQLGQLANNQVAQAGTQANIASTYADLAKAQGQLGLGQNQLNDQTMLQSQQMGYQLGEAERAAQMGSEATNISSNIDAFNAAQQLKAQQKANEDQWTHQLIAGGLTAAGAVGGTIVGGPAGGVAGAAGGNALGGAVTSDVRAKKNIKGASDDVSNAFRQAGQDADAIRGAAVQYPMATGGPSGIVPMAPVGGLEQNPYASRSGYYGLASNPFSTGGGQPALPTQPRSATMGLGENPYLSDVRSKKDISSAGRDVSNAIRGVEVPYPMAYGGGGAQLMPQETVRGVAPAYAMPTREQVFAGQGGEAPARPWDPYAGREVATAAAPRPWDPYAGSAPAQASFPDAPAYAYDYKNPSGEGAAPGRHYGPMAQDLEKTPAGASVVGEKGGRKFIDTSRLSLLNTSELAKQRKELDALKGQAGAISGTQVAYPVPAPYRLGGV